MAIDKKFVDQLAIVTSKAALASSYLVGKKDKIAADKAAVDSMRSDLNNLDIQGQIVIGEGELDKAPMLYIGEKLGSNKGPEFDIAVDPLEGTNFVANNLPGALSVITIAEKNNLFKAPETYMEKISTKVNEKNVIDLEGNLNWLYCSQCGMETSMESFANNQDDVLCSNCKDNSLKINLPFNGQEPSQWDLKDCWVLLNSCDLLILLVENFISPITFSYIELYLD